MAAVPSAAEWWWKVMAIIIGRNTNISSHAYLFLLLSILCIILRHPFRITHIKCFINKETFMY